MLPYQLYTGTVLFNTHSVLDRPSPPVFVRIRKLVDSDIWWIRICGLQTDQVDRKLFRIGVFDRPYSKLIN